MDYLFPNFLSSAEEYEQSVQFWRVLVAACRADNKDNWEDWLNSTFTDGSPMRDANPIYSLQCKSRRRAFLIIQKSLHENGEFDVFTKCAFGGDMRDPDAIELLGISCKLTQQNASRAQELIAFWMKESTAFEDMKSMIDAEK